MKNKKTITISVGIILIIAIAILGGYAILQKINVCENNYNNCVHDCGDGFLSSICKEKCTYDRNNCQENKT